jgi:colanic acid biosynthesis glycosyl transferase WcaI
MKIVINDFCGHAFTLSLAVELSSRQHEVSYVYFSGEPGPKGNFELGASTASPTRIHAIEVGGEYRKDAFLSRRAYDIQCGKQVARLIDELQPDIVLSTAPTETQGYVVDACKRNDIKFVYWMQDIYSIAASKLLKRKLGWIGSLVGGYYKHLDKKQLRSSDGIVLITEDFRHLVQSWTGKPECIDIVENWGVLKEIDEGKHDNDWSRAHGIHDQFNFVYSGTLGLKHDPERLAVLAKAIHGRGNVIVVSHGASVPYLKQQKEIFGLGNLRIFPLQPFSELPSVLASADVFVAMIEPDAGAFSVPSKVLSYLCAARPILLSAPDDNLSASIVKRAGAGRVVAPEDRDAFLQSAIELLDSSNRHKMGKSGRKYAETTFDMDLVCERFEKVFEKALGRAA